jgi:ribosomal protein S9
LQSTGETVNITAFVKTSGNVAIANQVVTFNADSGLLQAVSATTDDNGVASAKLAAGSNKANRDIVVKVTSGGVSGQVVVSVKGIQLALAGELALKLGASTKYTLKVMDGTGKVVSGASVVLSSSLGNVLSESVVTTDTAGTATFTYTATKAGDDTITAQSLGTNVQQTVAVSAVDLAFMSPVASTLIPVGTTQIFTMRYLSGGSGVAGKTVSFSTTRGVLVSSSTVVTNASGEASVSVSSNSAGPATVVAVIDGVGRASIAADFIAQTPSTIVMQSSLGAIPPNSSGSNSSQSTIEATVRDAAGNLVTGKAVNFNIVSDVSGGYLSTATVSTDQYGKAKVQYVAGTSSTAADGVVISGTVAGVGIVSNVKLTVNAKALFINIAYGNTMTNLDETTYSKPFSIYVTDATGNPVGNQQVTVSVIPKSYMKGWLSSQATGWLYSSGSPTFFCRNTDINRNGIYDPSVFEDANGNGVWDTVELRETSPLRPGNVVVATPGLLTTDSSGRASFSLQYGEQYAWWVGVDLTAKALVAGTESRTTQTLLLDMLADDASDILTSPANRISPFGTGFSPTGAAEPCP